MSRRVFLAGAAGAIGRRLARLLVEGGYSVTGTTRSASRVESLNAIGVAPVIVDVFDAEALSSAVVRARPDIVIHQLTDLPVRIDPARMDEALRRNARIRGEGTRNLVAAAATAGAHRLIAQSIAWAYAPGNLPHAESDPLDLAAAAPRSITVGGVAALEHAVLDHADLEGIALRYGRLYGPGTGRDAATDDPLCVHVDAAAQAALLAIVRGKPGAYNIAETDIEVSCESARRDLGWVPAFRIREAGRHESA